MASNVFMPVFHCNKDAAAMVGRMLAGYGELEFLLAQCLGYVIGDVTRAHRMYFRIWGARDRMTAADALMREPMSDMGFKAKYTTACAAMRFCHKLRNIYAHCHWGDWIDEGLYYTNLQFAARPHNLKRYKWTSANETALAEQEQYFKYAQDCLMFLAESVRYRVETRKAPLTHVEWPAYRPRPNLQNLPVKYIPLSLTTDPQAQPSAPPQKPKRVVTKATREVKAKRKAKWKKAK